MGSIKYCGDLISYSDENVDYFTNQAGKDKNIMQFIKIEQANPCQHPIVILRDVKYRDMEALLRFMYNGEVSVSNEQLPSVLHTARMLQVKGLADVPSKHYPNSKRVSARLLLSILLFWKKKRKRCHLMLVGIMILIASCIAE